MDIRCHKCNAFIGFGPVEFVGVICSICEAEEDKFMIEELRDCDLGEDAEFFSPLECEEYPGRDELTEIHSNAWLAARDEQVLADQAIEEAAEDEFPTD